MVCDGAKTVSAPAGDFQTVFGGARQSLRQTVFDVARHRDIQTVCDGVKTIITQTGDFQAVCDGARQSPIHFATCQDRLGNSVTVPDSLSLRRRLFGNLLQARTVFAPSTTV
ncbi:hypothetical protein DPMN_094738 [Dreissena polymorpha]|uniref:Uncharacterized protein n=1 Tax=Dreissena polymorpha TaxID=45954 RepID=A0A9D4L7Y2_DREPO|nr:hypothetical protein DPMN_094738 [Dreissena polymorpha]